MEKNRSTRFLIDIIDARLGDKRKEIKFDIAMIILGIALIIVSAIIISYTANTYPKLSILFIALILLGVFLVYIMTKEFINDKRQLKENK